MAIATVDPFPLLAASAVADGVSDAFDPSETRVRGIDLAGYAGTWISTLPSAETHWASTYSYGELAADRQEVTNLRLPGQYDERLLGSVGLQGPYYNWNRWYLPGVGRYLELDPIALRGRFNGAFGPDWYNYANGNPLKYTDRMGLYGTLCCGYYEYRCQQTGGSYYCGMAQKACNSFPTPGPLEPWGECVRKCLQDWDKRYPPDPGPTCSPGSPPPLPFGAGTAEAHAFCWAQCRNPELNPFTGQPEPNDVSCPSEYW